MIAKAKPSVFVACWLGLSACGVELDDDRFNLSGLDETGSTESDDAGESGGEADDGGESGEGDESVGGDGELGPKPEAEDTGAEDGEGEDATEGTGDEASGACVEFTDSLAPVPPSVLLLLDRSGSMMQTGFDLEDPDKSRWQSLHEAVAAVVTTEDMDHLVEFGAKTYSTKGWGECGVSPQLDVPIELDNAPVLLEHIPGPLEAVNGGTPTLAALEVGLGTMRAYEAEGAKAVVLITDGSIGCSDDEDAALAQAVGELTDAREVDGIATYVVGISPSYNSAKAQLGALAVAGGSDAYFEADDADALQQALAEVVADSYASSCLLDLEEAPSFPELVEVDAGGTNWPALSSCEDGDGWVWIDDELTRMRLCNAACDALLETREVLVSYYCDPG